jgi:hypothetical protein
LLADASTWCGCESGIASADKLFFQACSGVRSAAGSATTRNKCHTGNGLSCALTNNGQTDHESTQTQYLMNLIALGYMRIASP